MGFLDRFKSGSNEDRFWAWFVEHEDAIFNFELDQERIFDSIQANLQRVHNSLVFEISRVVDGKREFVISADGIQEAFPFVESTGSKAPNLERWKIVKFRPRLGTGFIIEMGDLKLGSDDISFRLEHDRGKIGIELFIDGFVDEERDNFLRAAFILIDTALGEYDVETKVGFIDLHQRESILPEGSCAFVELPNVFDRMYQSTLN